MTELREVLEAGPVLILLPGEDPTIVVGAWAFHTENGLAWAVPGFNMTPGQSIHFAPGTVEHTGGSEWVWTDENGAEYELTPAEPAISEDLDAQVQGWLDYRQRNPETTSRESARALIEDKIPDFTGEILI